MNRIVVQGDHMYFYSKPNPIPSGQSQFSVVEFMFSEEWSEFGNKIAQFSQGNTAYNVCIQNNVCYPPSELQTGFCKLRIKGYNGDAVIATANELMISIVRGFENGGIPPVPPTPDLYQQLIEQFQRMTPPAGGTIGQILSKQSNQDHDFVWATEVDPTVPSWAKQENKPTYTAEEVGALPDDTFIPTALSQLSDDSTHRTVTDSEKSTWNAKGTYNKPSSGIPKIDLAEGVQASLEKADSALQEHQSLSAYRTASVQDEIDAEKLTEPSSGLAVGKYFRVASIDSNGHAVLEAVDDPAVIKSIDAAGDTLTPDASGNVSIPLATAEYGGGTVGVMGYSTQFVVIGRALQLSPASNSDLTNRSGNSAITASIYDRAVKNAMCDGVGAAWTSAEQQAARERMGVQDIDDTQASATNPWSSAKTSYEVETVAAVASERYDGVDLTVKFASEIANYSDEWTWIKARITVGNYEGLNVHDYIPVTCTNGYILKPEIAGFDTYRGAGSTEIGRHIDFITKDCWPDMFQYNPANNNNGFRFVFTGDGTTADFVCDKNASNFSGATFTGHPYEINRVLNGATEVTSGWSYDNTTGTLHFSTAPESGASIQAQSAIAFFASNAYAYLNSLKTVVPNSTTFDGDLKDVDYTNGGVYSKLPQKLKNVITGKNMAWPTRCKASALQSNADNYKFATSLPLWMPNEMEVYGTPLFGTGTYEKWFGRQYPCFRNQNTRKGSGNGGNRANWLMAVAIASTTYVCTVSNNGLATYTNASTISRGPVCFRITA